MGEMNTYNKAQQIVNCVHNRAHLLVAICGIAILVHYPVVLATRLKIWGAFQKRIWALKSKNS